MVGSKSLCKDCNLVQAASSPVGSGTPPQSGPGPAAGAALVRLLYRGPQVPGGALGWSGGCGGGGSTARGGTGCSSRPAPQGGRMALLSSLARGRAPAHSHRWSASSTVKKSRDARDSRHRCARSESAQGLSLGLGAQQQQQQIVSAAASFPGHIQAPLNIFQGGPGWREKAGARPDGRLGLAGGQAGCAPLRAPRRRPGSTSGAAWRGRPAGPGPRSGRSGGALSRRPRAPPALPLSPPGRGRPAR